MLKSLDVVAFWILMSHNLRRGLIGWFIDSVDTLSLGVLLGEVFYNVKYVNM